ncbi:MAG: nucleotidyltransferase domain-containing protein [Elusimicrobiota bacterium]
MGVSVKQIMLFGSRAKGNYSKYSDYDFLVITKRLFPIKEKRRISKIIRENLSKFPVDIIIESEEEVKTLRNEIGTVVREAMKEGVVL